MARIGFLGTGEIAAVMVRTISAAGHDIVVSIRNERVSANLQREYPAVRRSNDQAVVDDSEIVVLCLLADAARETLPELRFRNDHTVVSVMAGMPIAEIAGRCAPASDICVAIPLPPMPLGGTPLAVYPANAKFDTVFGPHARIHVCASEAAPNAHFAATGILLPLLDQIDIAATWLAAFTCDRAASTAYLAGLLGGYCRMLAQEAAPDIADLRAGLGTEGGLNQTLSQALADSGALVALDAGLDGFRGRLHLPPKNQ
jgi:pyrroline-5-carboxylate reductase